MIKLLVPILLLSFTFLSCSSESEKRVDECKELEFTKNGLESSCNNVYEKYSNVYYDDDRSDNFIFKIRHSFNFMQSLLEKGEMEELRIEFNYLDELIFNYSDSLYYTSDESLMFDVDQLDSLLLDLEELYFAINIEMCPQFNSLQIRAMELRVLTCLFGYRGPNVFNFNKVEPVAYGKPSVRGEIPEFKVMFAAYDSTLYSTIHYWIDDSIMMRENELTFEAPEGASLKLFDVSKGEHRVYGYREILIQNKLKKKYFTYDFEVK